MKKYLVVFVVLFMFSSSLAIINVPVKVAAPPTPYVKVYVYQTGGYIPGAPVDDTVNIQIRIEVTNITDNSAQGIVGWGIYVQVDPNVLNITKAKGAMLNYFLYNFSADYGYPTPGLLSLLNSTTGYGDVSEQIAPTPPGGAGNVTSTNFPKLVTLQFISKSETAYSKIDLFDVEYMTAEGKWFPVNEIVDGHYNEYIPHNLTVQSTPIDGINFTASMHAYDSTEYTTNTSIILPEGNRTVTMPSSWMNGTDQYNFVEWEDTSTNPVRTISLTSNITIIATYELAVKKYTLTVNSIPITGVNFKIDTTTYATNQSVILLEGGYTVTMPSSWMNGTDRYLFRYWNDSSTDRQRTISLTSNTTIIATYGLAKNYTLTVNSIPITGVNFTIGAETYATNTSIILLEGGYTVTMRSTWMNGTDQYNFVEWEDTSTNPERTISLTSDTTITATYIPTYVKVYVNQSLGYIPGQPVDQKVKVDIIIEVTNITDNSLVGIVGWGMNITVDPDVLNITKAIGATSGYFLWNFSDYYGHAYPTFLPDPINSTSGYWENLAESIAASLRGAGDGSSYPTSSNKLVTLEFTSKSETAYSKIDLFDVEYRTADGRWHAVDKVVDGHYNEYIPHNLTVQSTPIDGINFTIDSTDYTTNQSVILREENYTVTMPSTWMVGTDQYSFVEWEDTSTNPVRTISLTSNITIIATYAKNYTLTVNSIPITGVNFTIGAETYATNTSIILLEGSYTVTMPSTWMVGTDQYSFVEWEDTSTNPERTISLADNTTITATYGRAPVASFTFSPAEPVVDDTVTFNASASEDPDGTIVNYAWEFGDGDSDTGVIVEHAYTAAGNYTVTLTVTDNDGLTHTITKTITVKEAPSPGPPLELYLIVAGVIGVIIIAIAVYYLKIMKPKQP